jgi:hypothetical protein
MINTPKRLGKGTLTTGSVTLYTVPASTTAVVKELILCNKTAGAVTVTVTFDGVNIVNAKSIAANDTLVIALSSVLATALIIAGLASANTAIDYYISGLEVA